MRLASTFPPHAFAASCGLFVLAAAGVLSQNAPEPDSAPAPGIVIANMDPSVRPGDDFYNYANGAWMKRTVLPPDRDFVDLSGIDQDEQWNDLTHTAGLIKDAVEANGPAGSNSRKIADLYHSYLDENRIETRGLAPLRPQLEAIAAIRDKHELARALGESLRADVDPLNSSIYHTPNLFGLWVAPGFADPAHYAAFLLQGGLEMPDREYYLSDSGQMRDVRAQYQAHVATLLQRAGFTDPEPRARRIIALEHALAGTHEDLTDSQDIHQANNNWKRTEFDARAPGLDWAEYFRGAGLSSQDSFIVWQPATFSGESALVASMALDTWKDWLAFHLIEDYADVLPKALADERFAFVERVLSGTRERRPRAQRAAVLVNRLLGDALGQLYAQRYFSPQAKAEVQAMVRNLIAAYQRRLADLPWMDPATKNEALAKLATLYVGIGYPETWRDYSGFEVKPDDVFGNLRRSGLFEYRRSVARLGQPVDRKEWCATYHPQTIDAVELPTQNALNFSAALLRPPYFDPQAPAAVNYGAVGALIGHEISHTFDNQGSAFDSTGRLRNWWKPADLEHFNQATARLAAQYDTYKAFPDLAVNGKQTLAENIADLAGLAAAYDAYAAALAGKPAAEQKGFSADQQFFLGFGQSWAFKSSAARLRRQVLTGTHSPAEYRAATVRNLDVWYTLFGVKPEDKLYLAPADRVRIW